FTCSRRVLYRLAATFYATEDECLDVRAYQKLDKEQACTRAVQMDVRHLRAGGAEDWSCSCRGDDCTSTDSARPSPSCGDDPEGGDPRARADWDRLCNAHLVASEPPPASTHRARYCANGAGKVIGDCPPPLPGEHCSAPVAGLPAWACFAEARECAAFLV